MPLPTFMSRFALLVVGLISAVSVLAAPQASDDNRTLLVNTSITIDVLRNDTDSEGQAFFLERVTQPENGAVTINQDGGVFYAPNTDFVGVDSFQYVISDRGEPSQESTGTVTVNVVERNFSTGPRRDNTGAVSTTIDSVCGALLDDRSDLNERQSRLLERCEALYELAANNPEATEAALRAIAPEETLALSRVGVSNSQFQSRIVSNRMSTRNTSGLSFGGTGMQWSSGFSNDAVGDSLLSQLGIFASVKLADAEKDETVSEAGFKNDMAGITVGADTALTDAWFVGGAIGWLKNDLTFGGNGGATESTEINFVGYSSFAKNALTFDFQLGYGNSDIDIERNITYQEYGNTTTITALGNTNGTQWFANAQIQYLYSKQAWTFYPSAKLQYASSTVDGYAENEANGWEMVLGSQDVGQLSLQTGLQGTYNMNQSWGVLTPNFELNAIADLNTDQGQVNGYFANAPINSPSFDLSAEEPDSFFYQAGIGVSIVLPGGTSGFLSYRKTLGYSDFSSQEWQAGFRMELN